MADVVVFELHIDALGTALLTAQDEAIRAELADEREDLWLRTKMSLSVAFRRYRGELADRIHLLGFAAAIQREMMAFAEKYDDHRVFVVRLA